MDAIKRHWDIRSADYNDFVVRGFSIERERRSWQEHFTSILGTEPLEILDVGCGPGIVSMQLADLGHRMTSVDLSDRMLEYARENARINGLDIDFRQADAMALPFGDDSFQAVVSDYMLWTVPDPEKVISEWYRVLKPGCTLAYTDGDWFTDPRMTPMRCRISDIFVRLEKGRPKDDVEREEAEGVPGHPRHRQRPEEGPSRFQVPRPRSDQQSFHGGRHQAVSTNGQLVSTKYYLF